VDEKRGYVSSSIHASCRGGTASTGHKNKQGSVAWEDNVTAARDIDAIESAPLRKVRFWKPSVVSKRRPDGSVVVRQAGELPPCPARMTDRLVHYAEATPDTIFLADRNGGDDWRTVPYAEALRRVRRIGAALLAFDLSAERPLLILSGNDIEHALLGLAAQYVGVPYASVSPAYSLVATEFGRLRRIADLLKPGLVFAADGEPFAKAIAAVVPPEIPLAVVRNPVPGRQNLLFDELEIATAVDAADRAHESVGPDTIAKFLFTSGSTGMPKAVINTQRMMTANQEMVRDCFAYMRDEPPIVLDWAPWNHTAGGNKVFNMVLYNGGTLYIDDGRPTPDGIVKTVRNLQDVAPTWYFNVPKGFEELVPYLEKDRGLRDRFFSRLSMMMYAGAGLGQHTWTALERLAVQSTGKRVLLVTGLGSTETAPFSMMCTVDQRIAGNIGIPARGIELKLVPVDGKYEARLKGPNVTPGYWRDPERTAEAFDEEGFYRLGDAFRFADPDDVSKGFYFDGRVADNFKLTSGTWVNAGALRAKLIDALGGLVRDAAITGLNRDFIGALVVPNLPACRELAGAAAEEPDAAVLENARVRAAFAEKFAALGRTSTGSSTFIRRIVLLADSPSIDRGEVTDKGSLNPRTLIANRASVVDELYAGSPRVIAAD
jgi:feruloyl-CoA synthase